MWKYLTYIKKGISHERAKTACQDSVIVQENKKWLVAALADGLGSLAHSDIAAATATDAVCQFFLNNDVSPDAIADIKFKQRMIEYVVSAMEAKMERLDISKAQADCTLVFVAINKKSNLAITGRLGDSVICVIRKTDSAAICGRDTSANGTNAIFDQDAAEHLELRSYNIVKDAVCGFILSSDGLDNELYMKGSTHVNKAAELYFNALCDHPSAEQAKQIISERIAKLTEADDTPYDDDISLAVISRINHKIALPCDPTWLCVCGERNELQSTYCRTCHRDFAALYQNVPFRKYGGKAVFFEHINQDPDEERKLLKGTDRYDGRPIPEKSANDTSAKATNTASKVVNKDREVLHRPSEMASPSSKKNEYSAKGTKKKAIPLLCLIFIIVGIISAYVIAGHGEKTIETPESHASSKEHGEKTIEKPESPAPSKRDQRINPPPHPRQFAPVTGEIESLQEQAP